MEIKHFFPIIPLLLVPVALAGGGQPKPITVTLDGASCQPYIGMVKFGFTPDPRASKQMLDIFTADQKVREPGLGGIDWQKMAAEDEKRRKETLALLKAGRLSSAADYVNAAFVFQHGNCPQHYQLANLLADQAVKRGGTGVARWIYAATFDRWQRSLGKPQKYGTQYTSAGGNCQFKLDEYDPATTDAERAKYNVPSLAQALKRADEINADCLKNQKP